MVCIVTFSEVCVGRGDRMLFYFDKFFFFFPGTLDVIVDGGFVSYVSFNRQSKLEKCVLCLYIFIGLTYSI